MSSYMNLSRLILFGVSSVSLIIGVAIRGIVGNNYFVGNFRSNSSDKKAIKKLP